MFSAGRAKILNPKGQGREDHQNEEDEVTQTRPPWEEQGLVLDTASPLGRNQGNKCSELSFLTAADLPMSTLAALTLKPEVTDAHGHNPYRKPPRTKTKGERKIKEDQTTYLSYSRHRSTAAAKSLQSCLTLCDPIVGSPPGSPVPGILQARTLEWVAISFSNASKWKVKVKSLSRVQLLVIPWTAAYQAPPSMGFSRQEY